MRATMLMRTASFNKKVLDLLVENNKAEVPGGELVQGCLMSPTFVHGPPHPITLEDTDSSFSEVPMQRQGPQDAVINIVSRLSDFVHRNLSSPFPVITNASGHLSPGVSTGS